jgi:hypothetical protein
MGSSGTEKRDGFFWDRGAVGSSGMEKSDGEDEKTDGRSLSAAAAVAESLHTRIL